MPPPPSVSLRRRPLTHVVDLSRRRAGASGMDAEGLYRVTGSGRMADALKLQFQYGRPRMTDSVWTDVNVISAVLKMYLRELPDSVIPASAYPTFSAVAGASPTSAVGRLKHVRNVSRCAQFAAAATPPLPRPLSSRPGRAAGRPRAHCSHARDHSDDAALAPGHAVCLDPPLAPVRPLSPASSSPPWALAPSTCLLPSTDARPCRAWVGRDLVRRQRSSTLRRKPHDDVQPGGPVWADAHALGPRRARPHRHWRSGAYGRVFNHTRTGDL